MLTTTSAAIVAPQIILNVRHAAGFAVSAMMWLAIGAAFL